MKRFQKPKPQTIQHVDVYIPHMRVVGAKIDGCSPRARYESAHKLRAYIMEEERGIDGKMRIDENHQRPI
jgi:hypothetical protein